MDEQIRGLAVDDSPFVFKAVKRALDGMEGVQVVGYAPDGQVGMDLVEELHPDVVTLDVTMPVMDGLQAAELLAAGYPEVRILMLSAMGDEDLVDRAQKLGVRGFLSKPFTAPELRRALFTLLRER